MRLREVFDCQSVLRQGVRNVGASRGAICGACINAARRLAHGATKSPSGINRTSRRWSGQLTSHPVYGLGVGGAGNRECGLCYG